MDSLITGSCDFPQFPHPIGVVGIAGKPENPFFSRFGNRGKVCSEKSGGETFLNTFPICSNT